MAQATAPVSSVEKPIVSKLSFFWNCVISSIASCTAETISFPCDLAKTRLQLQGVMQPAPPTQYRGMWHVLRSVPLENNQGIAGLYRGLQPALVRQCSYGTLKVVLYEEFKAQIGKALPDMPLAAVSVSSSFVAGTLSSAVCTPTDLVKVRMQAGRRPYRNLWHAASSIVRDEGWTALYKGAAPTTQRAVVVTVLNLSSYDIFKSHLMHTYNFRDDITAHLVGSSITGVFATFGTQPIDVVKSRIMDQPTDARGKGLLYRSSWHCMKLTVQKEGWQALWKGSVPNLCRSVPWLIIFWVTFEGLKGTVLQRGLR